MNYKLFIICLFLALASCKKRQYCLYRRLDLVASYVLKHTSKKTIECSLSYNYSDPYNVYREDSSTKKLDSLIKIEGYTIDSNIKITGVTYTIDGNCQYCDYYKSLYPYNVCEPREE